MVGFSKIELMETEAEVAIDRFQNDDGLAGMCRDNAGSNLQLQRLF